MATSQQYRCSALPVPLMTVNTTLRNCKRRLNLGQRGAKCLPSPAILFLTKNSFLVIQINHQPDATIFQFIILTFIYSSTCFRRFPAHHQELNDCSGSLWFYLRIVVIAVLCSWSGRPPRPRTRASDDGREKRPKRVEL